MKFFKDFNLNIPNKYKHNIENLESDNFYSFFDNVVLSCYFCGKRDPIHHFELKDEKQESDNYNYIKPLYDSCKEKDLHLVIFYDILSDKFIEKYSTDKIIFRKTLLLSDLSINDERFIIYYEYLLKNPYKNVLTSDISDVYINKNPFDLIDNYFIKSDFAQIINSYGFINSPNIKDKIINHPQLKFFLEYNSTYFTDKDINFIFNAIVADHEKNRYKIFIGTNSITNKKNWFESRKDKFDSFNKSIKSKLPTFISGDYQIYNPGTIMAKYFNYMCFLKNMLVVLFILADKHENTNWNMMIATYIIRTFLYEGINEKNACTKYIYTGFPFNSIYKRKEICGKSPNLIIHK